MPSAVDCAHSIQGAGAPLILVHDIGAARDAWHTLLPHLTQQFEVITYDLRGHGASPCPQVPFNLEDLVADLEQLRKTLGIARCHIAGHGLGGMIAATYARLHADRVQSLALVSIAAFRTQTDSQKIWDLIKAMETNGIPAVLPTLIDQWFTDTFKDAFNHTSTDASPHRPHLLQHMVNTDPEVLLTVWRIFATTDIAPWLPELAARTLILTGENDGASGPRLNRQIHEALPNSKLVVVPHQKHAIPLEAAAIMAQHLIDFIHTSK